MDATTPREPEPVPPSQEPAEAEPSMRPFFLLWASQAVSIVGSQAVQFALIWWLTVETGSAAVLATVTLLALLPSVILGPIIGPLIDRWNRKRTMLVADSAAAVAAALLVVLFLADDVGAVAVLAAIFARAVAGAFHGPAMLASTSLMVPKEHLTRIQGLNQALEGGLTIIAAPLGAFLYATLSMAAVFAVDVVSAAVAVLALLAVRVPQPTRSTAPTSGSPAAQLWQELREGIGYVGARRGLVGILIMAAIINLFLVPAFSLLPLLVHGELAGSATDLGWISSGFGLGALAGGIALGVWGGFRRRIHTSLAGMVGLGAVVLAIGFTPSSYRLLLIALLFGVGLLSAMANGPLQAILQATVTPDYQGRVFTLFGSLATVAAPIGLVLAAPIAEWVGVRAWYIVGGVVCTVMGTGAWLVRPIVSVEDGANGDPHENDAES